MCKFNDYEKSNLDGGDKVISDGKVMEVTHFSTEPTYEGLIMSLDGLTEIE